MVILVDFKYFNILMKFTRTKNIEAKIILIICYHVSVNDIYVNNL